MDPDTHMSIKTQENLSLSIALCALLSCTKLYNLYRMINMQHEFILTGPAYYIFIYIFMGYTNIDVLDINVMPKMLLCTLFAAYFQILE